MKYFYQPLFVLFFCRNFYGGRFTVDVLRWTVALLDDGRNIVNISILFPSVVSRQSSVVSRPYSPITF
ncbi:MAG: hypothetical protein ACPGVB_10570 [Chitinophagales bacterium]